jgi:hypothetical protein
VAAVQLALVLPPLVRMGEAVPSQVARVAVAEPDPMSHWRTGMGPPPALRQQLRLRQLAK